MQPQSFGQSHESLRSAEDEEESLLDEYELAAANLVPPYWGTEVSTSTVAALFSRMALTAQRIGMADMLLLVFTAYLPQGSMAPEIRSEDFFLLLSGGWWWWW